MPKIKIKFPKYLLKATDLEKVIIIESLIEAFQLKKAKHIHKIKPGDGENKIIAELENKFYGQLWKRKELNNKILKYIKDNRLLEKELNPKDREKFRKFLAKIFQLPIERINELVLKSFLIGALTQLGEKEVTINLAALPATIRDAIKQGKITWEQARFIQMAQIRAAEYISGIGESTQSRIKQMLIENIINGIGTKGFAQKLFEEFDDNSLLNRDMERIAITEINACANAGFISGIRSGEYVVGVSHKDACKWCLDNIHGKILKVIDNPPPNYADLEPGSKKYQDIAKIWDTCIWATKTNWGRSTAKNVRINGEIRKRKHHELASPGVLCHPNGRCRWVKFMPDYMYIKDGEIKYVSNDKEDAERKAWLSEHPEIKGE